MVRGDLQSRNLLSAKDRGLTASKHGRNRVVFIGFVTFFQIGGSVWKIEDVDPKLAVLGAWKADSNAVALHDPANLRRDFAQNLPQVEMRRHTIGEIEQQLQSLLRSLRIREVNRIVGCQSDLVGHETDETNLFGSVGARLNAGDDQTAQSAMRCGQRHRAKGSQPSLPHGI